MLPLNQCEKEGLSALYGRLTGGLRRIFVATVASVATAR
jgi:hypothetical protein